MRSSRFGKNLRSLLGLSKYHRADVAFAARDWALLTGIVAAGCALTFSGLAGGVPAFLVGPLVAGAGCFAYLLYKDKVPHLAHAWSTDVEVGSHIPADERNNVLMNCLAVGVGGFIGSILRYLIGTVAPASSFPWATLAINVVGSFALALIAGLVLRGAISDGELSLMLRVGLCGGFTTFSTYSLETVSLASSGSWAAAAAYAVGTVALCVLAALIGNVAARV